MKIADLDPCPVHGKLTSIDQVRAEAEGYIEATNVEVKELTEPTNKWEEMNFTALKDLLYVVVTDWDKPEIITTHYFCKQCCIEVSESETTKDWPEPLGTED